MSTRSVFVVGIGCLGLHQAILDQRHAAFHVQRGLHAGEGQTEFNQRDRDRGPHPDHHRVGVEDAGNGGDIVQHTADKAVDDFKRRDIDQHAAGVMRDDLAGQVFFQRGRQPVVHIDLDRDEKRVPELEDRNAVHRYAPCPPAFPARPVCLSALFTFMTARPVWRNATAKASARLAFEITFSSTPRCTMVWAICGRMPDIRQSAPISRAAATVLRRCWAVSVSTVGTPVMSMMAISASTSTMVCSRFSITTWVRWLSSVPISGSARMPSHNLTTGVDNSAISRCWRTITSSRPFWKASSVSRPSSSSSTVVDHTAEAICSADNDLSRFSALKSGCFSENTKVAVSVGEKPCSARERERSISIALAGS